MPRFRRIADENRSWLVVDTQRDPWMVMCRSASYDAFGASSEICEALNARHEGLMAKVAMPQEPELKRAVRGMDDYKD